MENQTNNQTNNLPQIVKNVIEHVSLDEIKNALFEEMKNGFEFSPQEYVPGPDPKKQSIFLKIANIMGALDRVPKTGHNKAQNYFYVTESDITGAVRPLMAKEKLVMIPSIRTYKLEEVPTKYSKQNMGTIEIEWIVRDAESYEVVKFTMIGKGTDIGEKDIYKAITGNKKYALITLFMIDSGDDPERDDQTFNGPPNNQYNNQYQGQNQSNNYPNRNAPANNQNAPQGQNRPNTPPPAQPNTPPAPPTEPPVKQPTKADLLTRWIVLAGSEKPKKEIREDFDAWHKLKTEEGWDHVRMIQALTKRLQEKNQAEKEKTTGQDGQATE